MRENNRLTQGIGINDATYPIGRGANRCKVHVVWARMLRAAVEDGVDLDPRWVHFMDFRKWCLAQGDVSNKRLIKSALLPNSNYFGPDHSAYVHNDLRAMAYHLTSRMNNYFPIGCSFKGSSYKPKATPCGNDSYYYTPRTASIRYRQEAAGKILHHLKSHSYSDKIMQGLELHIQSLLEVKVPIVVDFKLPIVGKDCLHRIFGKYFQYKVSNSKLTEYLDVILMYIVDNEEHLVIYDFARTDANTVRVSFITE